MIEVYFPSTLTRYDKKQQNHCLLSVQLMSAVLPCYVDIKKFIFVDFDYFSVDLWNFCTETVICRNLFKVH